MAWYINDLVKSYSKPKFWLAKPNKQIVARLAEVDSKSAFNYKFVEVSELEGEVPLYVERNHKTIRNKHFDLIKNKMYLKMQFMNNTMWFVINNVNTKANKGETLTFSAYSLEYNLTNKKLYEMEIETSRPIDAMQEVLDETAWRVSSISPKLVDKYRSFTFSTGTSVLDALYEMAESYGGILRFDTINETIKLVHEDEECTFDGFVINDKNYIDKIEDTRDGSEIVTRLYAIGSEGMTFNTVSPTGNSYVEDFSYFMYPFERDENKNVIKSSFYMSDDLCHALLNLKDAIDLWSPQILQKFEELKILQDSSYNHENTLSDAQSEFDIVTNRLDILRRNNEYYYHKSSNSLSESIRAGYYFMQARMIGSSSGSITISTESDYGTQTTPLNSGWTTVVMDVFQDRNFDPNNDKENINISFSGGTVEYYMVRVSESDYKNFSPFDSGHENIITPMTITKKYNIIYHGELVNLANSNVNDKETAINKVKEELQKLKDNLDERHFFTNEQLIEKNRFVYSGFWIEETHIDEKEMYDDCLKKISELSAPNVNMKLDVFNFLNSIEEKRNWEKLKIGKKIRIKHSKIDLYSEAILSEIDFNFKSDDLSLTVTGTKDVKDAEKELTKMLYDFAGASSTLALRKALYDDAANKANAASDYMKSNLDAAKRRVHAGVNESVELSNRGIVIKNPDYPDDLLILNSGVLVLSNDGGQTFRTAITPKGITADELVGKILITNKAWIQDDNGIVTIKGDLIEIKDNNGSTKVKIGQYEPGEYGMEIDGGSLKIIGGLSENNVSDAFKDGIITMSEIKVIEGHIKNLSQIKVEKDKIVSNLIVDMYISNDAKTNLNTAKTNFDSAYVSLISYINTIISDKKITEPERAEYENKNNTFNNRLETLVTSIQEAEKSIEDNNVNAFNDQLRNDLKLTAPLPTNISLNSSGITATTTGDANKYARLDYRGLYVQGGALDIRTDVSSSSRGMQINGNGIKAYDNSGNLKFSLDANTGNITMTSGSISWSAVNPPTASQVGARPSDWLPTESQIVGSKLTKIDATGVYTGTIQANQISAGTISGDRIYGGTITGTTISGGTLSGNTVTGASISGGSITGATFQTNNSSDGGQIRISGSTFTSTYYYDSGQYVQIKNGGLIIRTVGESTGTYQTIDMSGNYGLRISSTMSPSSNLRLDIYETESSYYYPVYKLHASGNYPDLRIISDDKLTLRGSTVNIDSGNVTVRGSTVITSSNVYNYVSTPNLSDYATRSWVNSSSSPTTRLDNLYNNGGSLGAWNIGLTNINSVSGRIKMSNDTGNIQITGTLSQSSNRSLKKNIQSFTKSGLDIVNSAKIREFNYSHDVDDVDMPRIGVVVDEAPLEIIDIDEGGKGVLIFDATWLAWKAIQEEDRKIIGLIERIEILELLNNQSTDVIEKLTEENKQLKVDINLIKQKLNIL